MSEETWTGPPSGFHGDRIRTRQNEIDWEEEFEYLLAEQERLLEMDKRGEDPDLGGATAQEAAEELQYQIDELIRKARQSGYDVHDRKLVQPRRRRSWQEKLGLDEGSPFKSHISIGDAEKARMGLTIFQRNDIVQRTSCSFCGAQQDQECTNKAGVQVRRRGGDTTQYQVPPHASRIVDYIAKGGSL